MRPGPSRRNSDQSLDDPSAKAFLVLYSLATFPRSTVLALSTTRPSATALSNGRYEVILKSDSDPLAIRK